MFRASRSLSVLVVEDTPAIRRMIISFLRQRGHRVTSVASGREALEHLAAGPFDAVLMDIELPDMDGCQASAAIRRLEGPSASQTPIIALTAHTGEGVWRRCLEAGMNAYVAKPIDVAQLTVVLEGAAAGALPVAREIVVHSADGRPAHSPQSTPVVDIGATMKRLGGDVELFVRFVEVFEEDAPKLLETIHATAQCGDWNAVRRAAHAIRGLAATFGAHALTETALRLEQAAADEPAAAVSLAAQLKAELSRVREALSVYRAS